MSSPTATLSPAPELRQQRPVGGFRTDLEGLRAVAVALVVLYHAHLLGLTGGYVGVDVFYVLSGFFITGLLVREFERSGRINFGAFYLRRARRLLPASAVVLLATGIAGFILFPFVRWSSLGWDLVSAALNVANFRFAVLSTDYLAQSTDPSPVLHFWSLGVEEQFYLFWPLIVLAFLAWGRRRSQGRAPLLVGIAVIAVLSFAAGFVLTAVAQSWSFFMLPTRAWELAGGAALALLAPHIGRLPVAFRRAVAIVGLAAVVLSAFLFNDHTPVPGTAMLVPVLGTMAVIVGGDAGRFGLHSVLRVAPMRAIGRWSYSIYLWHWPLLVFPAVALDTGIAELPLWLRLVLCAASVLAGALSYALVERVFRAPSGSAEPIARVPSGSAPGSAPDSASSRRRNAGTGRGITVAVLCTAVSLVAGAVLIAGPGLSSAAEAPRASTSSVPSSLPSDPTAQLRAALGETTVPRDLNPSLLGAATAVPAVYGDGCHLDFAGTSYGPCTYGEPAAARTVVLVGDSHAAQWFPVLESLAQDDHWKLISLTKSGCPATSATLPHPTDAGRSYTECRDAHSSIVQRVKEVRPQLVLVSSLVSARADGAWFSGVSSYISALREAGAAQVMVLGDTPRPAKNVPDCLAKNLNSAQKCTAAPTPASLEAKMRSAAERGGALYQPTTEWLCVDGRCPTVVDAILIYRDESHLTPPAVLWQKGRLAGALATALEQG